MQQLSSDLTDQETPHDKMLDMHVQELSSPALGQNSVQELSSQALGQKESLQATAEVVAKQPPPQQGVYGLPARSRREGQGRGRQAADHGVQGVLAETGKKVTELKGFFQKPTPLTEAMNLRMDSALPQPPDPMAGLMAQIAQLQSAVQAISKQTPSRQFRTREEWRDS